MAENSPDEHGPTPTANGASPADPPAVDGLMKIGGRQALDVLLHLDDATLSEVLVGAERPALEGVLEHYDLLPVWKRKGQTSRRAGAVAVAPLLRERATPDDLAQFLAIVLFTWWIRAAESRLKHTSVWPKLRGLTLFDQLSKFLSEVPTLGEDVRAALSSPGPSAPVEDRLVSVLGRGFIEQWQHEKLIAVLHSEIPSRVEALVPAITSKQLASAPPSKKRTSIPAATEARAPAPRAPSLPPDASVAREASAEQAAFPGLAEVEKAILECVLLRQKVQTLVESSQLDAVRTALAENQAAEEKARASAEEFLRLLGIEALKVPPDALLRDETARQFIRRLRKAAEEQVRRASAHFAESRLALVDEIEQLGIAVPSQLAAARSVHDLAVIRGSLAPAIRIEWALRQFKDHQGIPDDLSAEQKREVFERALATGQVRPSEVLQALVADPASLHANPSVVPLLERVIEGTLDGADSLPRGTWSAIIEALGLPSAMALAEAAVVLGGGDVDRLDPPGLVRFQGHTSFPDLQRVLLLADLHRLEPKERARRAASLALEHDLDGDYLAELARSLMAADRCAEVLALIVFGLHADRQILGESEVRPVLVRALLERVASGPDAASIVRSLIADPRWLLGPDSLPALVYLAGSIGETETVETLRLVYPREWEDAVSLRPRLIDGLTGGLRAPVPRQVVVEARDALRQLRHGMDRRSCYAAWGSGCGVPGRVQQVSERGTEGHRTGLEKRSNRR